MKRITKTVLIGLLTSSLLVAGLGDVHAITLPAMSTQFCNGQNNVSIDTNEGAQQELCYTVTNRESTAVTYRQYVSDGRVKARRGRIKVYCYAENDYRNRGQGALHNATSFTNEDDPKYITFTLQPNETKVTTAMVDVPALGRGLGACMVTEAGPEVTEQAGSISVKLRKIQFFHLY